MLLPRARLIGALWLKRGKGPVMAVLEVVAHATSIYSGILRPIELALGAASPNPRRNLV